MAGASDCQAAPGELAAASARGPLGSSVLERLEPPTAPPRLHAVVASPTPRSADRTGSLGQPSGLACTSFSCPAGALPPLVGRAAGSQCPCPNGWSDNDQTLRRPGKLCHFARFGHGVNATQPASRVSASRSGVLLRVASHGLFAWFFRCVARVRLVLRSLPLFCHPTTARHPALQGFRSPDQG